MPTRAKPTHVQEIEMENTGGEIDGEGEVEEIGNQGTALDRQSDFLEEDAALAAQLRKYKTKKTEKSSESAATSKPRKAKAKEAPESSDASTWSCWRRRHQRVKDELATKSKVKVKEEDLQTGTVPVPSRVQAALDEAFLGYVRVAIVNPDSTVKHEFKTVNHRDTDTKHKNEILSSLRINKTDWEQPLNVLIQSNTIDAACLSQSMHPLSELKPIAWTVPAGKRRVEYLSGGHRQKAAQDLYAEKTAKKEALEKDLETHLKERAASGQKDIMDDGTLGDRVEIKFRDRITEEVEAAEEARLWTLKVYDDSKIRKETKLLSLLATNEARPTKAAGPQEKVQMLGWRIEHKVKMWREEHPDEVLPIAGSRTFRSEILNQVVSDAELKEGIANFLFTQQDNFVLTQDLWQLRHFQVTGKVPLTLLEKVLGKVGKKDLSKKSGSSMVWRWLIHQLMRDLRVVGTTHPFPNLDDTDDKTTAHYRNYKKVVTGSHEHLHITEEMWIDSGYETQEKREREASIKKAQQDARENAKEVYDKLEDVVVIPQKLSQQVWTPEALNIVDDIYEKEFQVTGANENFGDWDSKEWSGAMKKYRAAVKKALPAEWKRTLQNIPDHTKMADEVRALRQAEVALAWFQQLQAAGARTLDVPFLCGKFVEDFSRHLQNAEHGLKLISRTLDPLLQVGLLRAAQPDDKDTGRLVFNDYLSYVVHLMTQKDRFHFKNEKAVEDNLCHWILKNLNLITICGIEYHTRYLHPEHEMFYSVSVGQITTEVSKLHVKKGTKEPIVAKTFPSALTKALPSVTFTPDDCAAILDIFKILTAAAVRDLTPHHKLVDSDKTSIKKANADVMGRCLPALPLVHVKKHPCLNILYRHGLPWQTPEGGAKTGKANGFFAYAYLLYIGWRVYGDSIGKMMEVQEYLDLRRLLFKFLGAHCQPTLDDFYSEHDDHPNFAPFANWDHKIIHNLCDLHGETINVSGPKRVATVSSCRSSSKDIESTATIIDPSDMATHTAHIKKIIDAVVKSPLARVGGTPASCTPEIAALARRLSLEYLCNALLQRFVENTVDFDVPYVHLSDADLVPFLPPLPKAGQPLPDTYRSFEDFASEDPSRYQLFCHGLVAEGYMPAPGPSSTSSSAHPTTFPRSDHPSGHVYTQELNWMAPWAKVSPDTLSLSALPDPAAAFLPTPSRQTVAPLERSTAPLLPNCDTLESLPKVPPAPTTQPTNNVPGAVSRFNVPPRRAKSTTLDAPTVQDDPIDVGSHRVGDTGGLRPPPSPGIVFVPSSSQAPVSDPEDVSQQPPSSSSPPVMSSPLPQIVPSTFPDEPSQPPLLPRPRVFKTITRRYPEPTPAESAAFEQRVKSIDESALNRLLSQAVRATENDERYGLPALCDVRPLFFWAFIRDRKRSLVPDDIFAYMRDDHQDVTSGVSWEDLVIDFAGGEGADPLLHGTMERFKNRHQNNFLAIYDAGVDLNVETLSSSQDPSDMEWNAISRASSPRLGERDRGKRRERSNSLLDDVRKDGGMSPPKERVKRYHLGDRDGGSSSLGVPLSTAAMQALGTETRNLDIGRPPPAPKRPRPTTSSAQEESVASKTRAARKKEGALHHIEEDVDENQAGDHDAEMTGQGSETRGKGPVTGRRLMGCGA